MIPLLLLSLFSLKALDGWYDVPPPSAPPIEEEAHPGWVVFARTLEGERWLVQFPKDPSYGVERGGFFATAREGGVEMRLEVMDGGKVGDRVEKLLENPAVQLIEQRKGERGVDLLYQRGEQKVCEHLFEGKNRLYILQTVGDEFERGLQAQFVDSLDITRGF